MSFALWLFPWTAHCSRKSGKNYGFGLQLVLASGLYGLEVCPVSVSDMRSLEFTVKRIMIKLFRTYDSGIVSVAFWFSYSKWTCWTTYKQVSDEAEFAGQ